MNTIEYKIYQLKEEYFGEYAFISFDMLKDSGKYPSLANYNLAHSEKTLRDILPTKNYMILDLLFRLFNNRVPNGYSGRSMSVSDIVEINGEFYYCDSVGWVRIFHDNEVDVTEKILKNHKAKSEQLKELKKKLKKSIPTSVVRKKLAYEISRDAIYLDYYNYGEFDDEGYKRAVAKRSARIELLRELLDETGRH